MNKIITSLFLLFSIISKAQLYTGPTGVITNNGQNTYFDLTVSGLSPAVLDSTFGIEEVCIDINHTNVSELNIYLKSPSGTLVSLSSGSSSSGANYTSTCFNHTGSSSITVGSSPYTGSHRPIGFLGRFQNGQAGNGVWRLIVKDYAMSVDSGSVNAWSIKFSASPSYAAPFTSSNLPLVIINTSGQEIAEENILVDMGMIYNGIGVRNYVTDAHNEYDAKASIKFRGNSTKNFEKKAYSFETKSAAGLEFDVSLLGMPAENDWVLLAPYPDKTLMRVPLAYDLYRKMGRYAARLRSVEVILNNEYVGIYNVVEKLKRNNDRIDVAKLTPTDNSFPEITGGYIFQIDRGDEEGWTSLFPGDTPALTHFHYEFEYPKDSSITLQQKAYIKSYVDSFEIAMESPTFADPLVGYPKYIDVGSFVDYFIMSELSKNVDAYRLSTYLYKDKITKGGKLHIGPVWDFDLAWHNCNYGDTFNPNYWQYLIQDATHPTPRWWGRFFQDTTFVNDLYCRWTELRQDVLNISNLNAYIDSTMLVLNESQARNFTQWPVMGAFIHPNPQSQVGASYAGEVNDLKNWLVNRISWMDGAIIGMCNPVGQNEIYANSSLVVYPNPFTNSTTFSMRIDRDENVSLSVVDVMGREIFRSADQQVPAGEFKIVFERDKAANGIYFYQLRIGSSVKSGKIVIE